MDTLDELYDIGIELQYELNTLYKDQQKDPDPFTLLIKLAGLQRVANRFSTIAADLISDTTDILQGLAIDDTANINRLTAEVEERKQMIRDLHQELGAMESSRERVAIEFGEQKLELKSQIDYAKELEQEVASLKAFNQLANDKTAELQKKCDQLESHKMQNGY